MDGTQPPPMCAQCGDPLEPDHQTVLSVRHEMQNGKATIQDVAVFHPVCWDVFRQEHSLAEPSALGSNSRS
jgi:hypothetical protein